MGLFGLFKKKDEFSKENFGDLDSGVNSGLDQVNSSLDVPSQTLNSSSLNPSDSLTQQQVVQPVQPVQPTPQVQPASSPELRQLNASYNLQQTPEVGKYDIQLIQKDISLILETLNGMKLVLNSLDTRIKKLEEIAENEQKDKDKNNYW